MQIKLDFQELVDFIENKYKIKIDLVGVDEKTLAVGYKPMILPKVKATLRVEEINNDFIALSYDCNMAVPMLVGPVVNIMSEKIPAGIEIDADNKRVKIHLLQIEKLNIAMEFVTLRNVVFANDAVNIELSFA